MASRLWDGTGPVLADASAWMQARRDASARDLLLAAIERDEARWCWPVRYELMIDARSSDGIAAVERTLDALREVPVDRGPISPSPSRRRTPESDFSTSISTSNDSAIISEWMRSGSGIPPDPGDQGVEWD